MTTAMHTAPDVAVESLSASAYEVPTDQPESDGTLEWDSTTLVVVEVQGGGETGIGYTYCHEAAALVAGTKLAPAVEGVDAMSPPAAWASMRVAIRQLGQQGIAAMAVSAVDIALWDLKARLLGRPLADVLPRFRESVPVYGSGGFTSYSLERLRDQLGGWAAAGMDAVKMKVGRDPEADARRLRAVEAAIGGRVSLMVDANGAYDRKQALDCARTFAAYRVCWLEEPLSSEDLEGLALLRDRGPAGMSIAAGEYGWDLPYFQRMLDAGAVDVLQADVTRCGGITGMLRVDGLCKARSMPLSGHCAPQASAHALCASETVVHLEYFHDHARVEGMLFDGALEPQGGELKPDRSRPGLGIELRRADAEPYRVR